MSARQAISLSLVIIVIIEVKLGTHNLNNFISQLTMLQIIIDKSVFLHGLDLSTIIPLPQFATQQVVTQNCVKLYIPTITLISLRLEDKLSNFNTLYLLYI